MSDDTPCTYCTTKMRELAAEIHDLANEAERLRSELAKAREALRRHACTCDVCDKMSDDQAWKEITALRSELARAREEVDELAGIVDGHRRAEDRAWAELALAREVIKSARAFVERHPALKAIDRAEFEAFLKVPAALAALQPEEKP